MILIIGSDASGKTVAEDKTDSQWKAGQIADTWRDGGLTVVVVYPAIETAAPERPNR